MTRFARVVILVDDQDLDISAAEIALKKIEPSVRNLLLFVDGPVVRFTFEFQERPALSACRRVRDLIAEALSSQVPDLKLLSVMVV